jgi:hypothetical protein
MEKIVEIPEGYEARIEGNKVVIGPKESEDEKVRKTLIDIVKRACSKYGVKMTFTGEGLTEEKLLAYLEKQKELPFVKDVMLGYPGIYFYDGERMHFQGNPAVEEKQKEQKQDDIKREWWNKGYLEGRKNAHIPAKELGLPKSIDFQEQKPAEGTALQKAFIISKKDYTLEEKCDASDYADAILPTSVAYGENEEEYKLHKIIEAAFIAGQKKEQKPAEWSEEDRRILKGIIGLIDHDQHYGVSNKEMIDWLKSLRPQPKQEWSEEDKRAIDRACVALRAYSNGDLPYFLPSELLGYADRLQSLRPQPHWTEEDRHQVDVAISFLKDYADKGYENAVACIDWLNSKIYGNTCE